MNTSLSERIRKSGQLLGAHTSINGGFTKSVPLAQKLGFNAMQIFTQNNNRWEGKPIDDADAMLFRETAKDAGLDFVVSHNSYLTNLCAMDDELLRKSRQAFLEELKRCERLGIPCMNFHPGAHGGAGVEDGIKKIAESLNLAHQATPGYRVKSMLEATAGQGTSIGHTFEQLAAIIELVEEKERMSVCIDTAHIFAAGYDISTATGCDKVFREFDEILGLDRLECFHVNDSKKPQGSRVDRHEHLGKGTIGAEGFRFLMNDQRLRHIPKILETPKGKEQLEDIENLELLLSLLD